MERDVVMELSRRDLALGLAALVLVVVSVVFGPRLRGQKGPADVVVTLGDIQAVHAVVTVGEKDVRRVTRFSAGDRLKTSADGRARIRLDDGTTVVVDRDTELVAMETGLELARGRVFVKGGRAARTELRIGEAATIASASALALARAEGGATVYCADGEAIVTGKGKPATVRSGETATIDADRVRVAPEKAFNDWTGGMATPWGAGGKPRPAIGELWGRTADGQAGSPLAVRLHDVQVRLDGEVALTHIETTYFNGGSSSVRGEFRLAMPEAAIVSRFAVRRDDGVEDGVVRVGRDDESASIARLEWAGPGWVQGRIPYVASGATVTVVIDYVEWLDVVDGRMAYRYPMVSADEPPLLGEFRIQVDATRVKPTVIRVGPEATVERKVVEFRKADLRPEADFVVELGVDDLPTGTARAYTGAPGEDGEDPYYLLRAAIPPRAGTGGVTLAIVVDTSRSVAPSVLETSRTLVESILQGLGATDRVALFAADQGSRSIGAPGLLPVDADRRAKLRRALSGLRPAGATDLGAALERAADAIGKDAPDGMVVYVGDGRPTMGDVDFDAIRARLARRPLGIPRLGAVAVGPSANRFGLDSLVRDAGPVLALHDQDGAPEAAVALLTTALLPVVSGVEVDLGPGIDRVYPRGPQVTRADGTVMVVGRIRGKKPANVIIKYREGAETVEKQLPVVGRPTVKHGDVRRRWASARVKNIIVGGESTEIAADVARRANLLTPWTGFFVGWGDTDGPGSPLAHRVSDPADLAMLGPQVAEKIGWHVDDGAILEPPPVSGGSNDDFRALISAAAGRTLDGAMPAIRRCHAARAAERPDIEGPLTLRVELTGSGRVSAADVRPASPDQYDAALHRCITALVSSLRFFDSGTTTRVTVQYEIELPPPPSRRARKCSETSKMPLALRAAVWRERGLVGVDVYEKALLACETPRWDEKRALLDLMLQASTNVDARLSLAEALATRGHDEAAAYVRRIVIRSARTPADLARVREALVRAEPEPGKAFAKQYERAKDDRTRLSVVRRFLELSPHDPQLRRALFGLLHAVGEKDALVQAIYDVRQDPFADAALLSDGAAWLRRIGRDDEGRRAFGELIERAPRDPYARATAGDRLRDEGLFDEATAAYEVLVQMLPDDPAASMRLALAHAGAGRLDLATRTLARVAQTGGRTGDTEFGELASITSAVLLAEAKAAAKGEEAKRLERRIAETPMPDVAAVVLVRSPVLRRAPEVRVVRAREGAKDFESPADLVAPTMGLFARRVERGAGEVRVRLRREPEIGPTLPAELQIDWLELDAHRVLVRHLHETVEVPPDGEDVEIGLTDGGPR